MAFGQREARVRNFGLKSVSQRSELAQRSVFAGNKLLV